MKKTIILYSMKSPFLPTIAYGYCRELFLKLSSLVKSSELTSENLSSISLEYNKNFHHEPFFEKNSLIEEEFLKESALFEPAIMIGVLVCKNKKGRYEILKAFSGQWFGKWHIDGWCDPCFDVDAYTEIDKKTQEVIKEYCDNIKKIEVLLNPSQKEIAQKQELIKMRKDYSLLVMKKLFLLYSFNSFLGRSYSILDLQKEFDVGKIPTGFGDCCAPKLLNAAIKNGLMPLSMGEFYFGKNSKDGTKQHGCFYEPCDYRCKKILPAMIGLDILYVDSDIVVINKPSGLLSVPGIGADKQDCVSSRIRRLYDIEIENPAVHRLDMDTSGVMVYALHKHSHRELSIQFQNRIAKKRYIAKLNGVPFLKDKNRVARKGDEGTISIPIRLDIENRPYQIVDYQNGKESITQYQIVSIRQSKTKVMLSPITGRTHQLRVHCASKDGLGVPIISDRLYGQEEKGIKLMLQAFYLMFYHPTKKGADGAPLPMEFEIEHLF